MLRYFGAREHIYLQLTAEGLIEWGDAVIATVGDRALEAADLADILADLLVERPLLCDLIAHLYTNFDDNISPAAARELMLLARENNVRLATFLSTAVPVLDHRGAKDLITATYCFVTQLWRRLHPGPVVATLYENEPNFPDVSLEFKPTLRRLLFTFILGAACRPGEPAQPGTRVPRFPCSD